MDEIWERAVETALDGERNFDSVKNLTLDGAVKCVHGKLPPPSIFERFTNLEHLSIANIGVSSLEQFPQLRNLQKLILSDNRIAGGVEFLVDAGLNSLRDLDLSNNRINDIDDLRPLAELRLVSLDLYECPVTRVKDYRSRVFGLIKSLKYLDKMDVEGNERPESDDEEDDDEEEEDDPGSGEVDGEDRPSNGHRVRVGSEGVVDVDESESDADEEEMEIVTRINGVKSNENDDEDEDDDEDFVEEIDEDDDDVVEVHEIEDSDEEEDGVEDDDEDGDDEDEDEEEVDNDEGDGEEPESTGRLNSTEGEIDGHEHGEDDGDDDDDGETGEEEQGVEEEDGDSEKDDEDAEDEEEDNGNGYLVQPVGHVEVDDAEGSDMEPVNGDEDPDLEEELEDEDDYGEVQELPPSTSQKRKRDCEDDDGEDDDKEFPKSSKHR